MKQKIIYLLLVLFLAACAANPTYNIQGDAAIRGFNSDTIVIKQIKANDLIFKCRVIGDQSNPSVILLHGWPETSHMWEDLMIKLSKEGYFCIAPDQRGFSEGARPKGKKHYKIKFLAEDIIALADSFGLKKFHLIGHDWGSAIGWAVIEEYPDEVKSWTAMSVPHIEAFSEAIRSDPEQQEMSTYMRQFQFPWIPEWMLSRNDHKLMRDIWTESSPEEVKDYLKVFGSKSGLTASLNYYRSNYKMLKKGKSDVDFGKVSHPTLMIWGKNDKAIGKKSIELTAPYMTGYYKLVELDAGHWLIQEKPDTIFSVIKNHLEKNPL